MVLDCRQRRTIEDREEREQAGTLLIAAAGNASQRDAGQVATVEYPVAFRGFFSVGTVLPDAHGQPILANSSPTRSSGETGGRVDVVAPGDYIRSSWRSCDQWYQRTTGSSPSTGYVAGIAALHAQQPSPGAPGPNAYELWNTLKETAVGHPSWNEADYGAGLVQAPG